MHRTDRLTRRSVFTGAAGLMLTATLSGCAETIGAAATVGSVSIGEQSVVDTQTELLEALQSSGQASAAQLTPEVRTLFNRQILTQQIRHQLLAQATGLPALTPEAVDISSAPADQLAVALWTTRAGVPTAFADYQRVTELAKSATKAVDTTITVAQESFATRAAAVSEQATRRATGVGPATTDSSGQVSLMSANGAGFAPYGFFAAPVGTTLVIPTESDYKLFTVTARGAGEPGDLPAAINQASSESPAVQFWLPWIALQPYAAGVAVSINPRFGAWDPISLQVVPAAL